MFKRFSLIRKKIAVALKYAPETLEETPQVIAKGFDNRADTITALAKKEKIPIHVDPELAQLLASTELGGFIPPTTFLAVAKILRLIYERTPKKRPNILHSSKHNHLGNASTSVYNAK